ncbi:Cytochrome C oxidase, cbb3-type, subunit III [Azotobacter beijerinckii]|uniref:Cytochrome C oxidase, cbb3-type, subunit III n=1 Tax=Azotobacter beijerinckii TaxID=170623 RepID=A0A1H9FKA9_9GAMM|nr:cytochrome c [Azotobacter beijerinckii]SEQ37768.1 Cytochrome C oxidase, cbb3-type, subunit III [Azotobacter beijerinckii]
MGVCKTLAVSGLAVAAIGAGVVYSGLIEVGADVPHSAPVHAVLETLRERSIAVRAEDIQVPSLGDEALIRAGAGNYDAMCVGCHLAPGLGETELSRGLYPAPPNLSRVGSGGNPAGAFWVIKHGIKSSAMPAWGRSMADQHIWELVAFVERLPSLDAEAYRSLVASSSGHRHGGGESLSQGHGGSHHEDSAPAAGQGEAPASKTHIHADGKRHVH